MKEIQEILSAFEPVSLEQMDNVKLLNRMDAKFTFNMDKLFMLLPQLTMNYRVLEVNGSRINSYESLYFDTPAFDLYQRHHNGRLNRYKVRFRKYIESNLHFFEIKFKNNKGRTIKRRIEQEQIAECIEGESREFLNIHSTLSSSGLEPKLWVNFTRITLVHKTAAERVTIDTGLTFRNQNETKKIPNLIIAEVKQSRTSPSDFVRLMRNNFIREGSISKYCFGIVTMYNQIRKNNFKPQIQLFNKLSQ